jgi:hypothetical protein
MKTRVLLVVGVLWSGSSPVAQQLYPGPPQGDVVATVGWLNVDNGRFGPYEGWSNRGVLAGVAAGWLWTDHLKTEVDVSVSGEGEVYAAETVFVDGQPTFTNATIRFRTTSVAASQQYQFFRNAWLHPHVAAGLDVTWERSTQDVGPVFVYELTRPARQVRPAMTIGPETLVHVRPFVATGLKAYLTPRMFFRTDVRLVLRDGIDEAAWRFGIGTDF